MMRSNEPPTPVSRLRADAQGVIAMNETTDELTNRIEGLKELADRHSACYEIWPEYDLDGDKQIKVGYSLELYGTHDHGSSTLTPGCDRCTETYRDLRKIAEWILPRDERPSRYEIEPFDHAMHEAPKRKLRPEV